MSGKEYEGEIANKSADSPPSYDEKIGTSEKPDLTERRESVGRRDSVTVAGSVVHNPLQVSSSYFSIEPTNTST